MPIQSIAPIKQAFVAKLRTNLSLVTGLTGGIHEGVAIAGKKPPLLIYDVLPVPRSFDWSNVHANVLIDVLIHDHDSVRAGNLNQLVIDTMNDAVLSVSGQSILLCRIDADLSSADNDEAGEKVYMVGGTYRIIADQHQ